MEWVAGYALALDMTARYKGVHRILAVVRGGGYQLSILCENYKITPSVDYK